MGKKPTKTLPTLEVSADAPNWLKYAREYNEKNPFDLQEYVNKRFKNLKGREKIEVIDQEEFKQKVIRQGLEKRRKDLYKYVRKQLKKNNPRGKKSRGKWLNSFSDKEQQILLSDPKNQPSFWKDSIDGLLFNPSSVVSSIVGKDPRKNSDYYSDYEKSQKESLVDKTLKSLGPLDIGSKLLQAPFMDDYTVGDALKGKKNDAPLLVDLINPLDLLGIGILGKANRVRKAIKLPKSKNLKPISKYKSEIDWAKWNPEISQNESLMDEYLTIEKKSKADGTWMKDADGNPARLPNGRLATPEQWVQAQSKNWEKAYGKKGLDAIDQTYRGSYLSLHSPTIRDVDHPYYYKSIFSNPDGNMMRYYTGAQRYNEDPLKNNLYTYDDFLKDSKKPGIYELALPKSSNTLHFSALGQQWNDLWIDDIAKLLPEELITEARFSKKKKFTTNTLGKYLDEYETPYDRVKIDRIQDGMVGDVLINKQVPGNYHKSLRGNNGMFDLSNPNIYKSLIPPAIGTGLGMQHYNNKDMKKKPKYLPGKLPTLPLLSNIEMPIGSTQYQKAANSMSYEQPPMGKPSREFFMSGDVGYGISSALLSASVAHAGQAYANKRNMQSYLHSINPHAKYGQTPIMQSSFIEKLLENPEFNAKDKEYLTKHFSKLINNKGVSEGNSEVEGGEIIRNSITGENYKMDGKSHAKGGIQMNVKPEDAIYSQALTGVNGKKISDTAKEHMKIEKDLTKNINSRPNDQRSMNTYKRMMDKLKKEELLNMIIQESHAKKGMYKYGKKPMYYMGKNPNSTQITQEELEEIQANFVNKQPTKNLMGEGGIYNDYLDWSLGPNFEYKPSKQTTNNNFIPFTSGNQLLFGPYPKQAQNSSFGYNFMTELMKANMNNRNTTQTSSTLPFSKTGINANSQTSPIDIQGNTVVEKGFGTKKYRYNPDVVGRNLIATGQLPGGISIHPEPTDIGITNPMSKNRKKLNLFNKPLFGESNLTDSEKIGLLGNVGSAVTPLISALAFNPTPNTNYFNRARGFGQESTRLMRNSGNFIDDQEAKALDDITLASNASRRNIQNRLRNASTINAFESAAGAREGAAKSDVRNKAALASANIASVLGEKISRDEQLEATGDTQVEIRDQQDYATRANRIAEGVSNLFAGTQAIGQSMSSRVYQMMQTDAYKQLAEQVGNATALQLLLGINLNSSKKEES